MRWSLIWGYGIAAIWTGIAIAGLIHSVAAQNTLRVPGQYATIQAAIQAAQPNDRVLVAPGRYVGNIQITKDIILQSSGGPFVTTLDGGGLGPVVSDGGGLNLVLDGFTITKNGNTGIALSLGNRGLIRNNRIVGNHTPGYSGGGIDGATSAHIVGNYIAGNSSRFGGGIYTGASGGWARIYRNVIVGNRASIDGGGIYSSGGNWNELIYENAIVGNTAGRDGGGVFYVPPLCDFDNNMVIGNTAGRYGGGVFRPCCGPNSTMSHCTVAFNRAAVAGGGLWVDGWTHDVYDSIFWGNTAPLGRQIQVGLSTLAPTTMSLDTCIVEGGRAGVQVASPLSTLYWGAGMLTSDPQFVDPSRNDCHLRVTSPAIGANSVPQFATDFEGDIRTGTNDIGADEFAEHLYVAGSPRPGQPFALRVIGRPGQAVFLAIAARTGRRPTPLTFPGITGALVVPDPFAIVPAGRIGPDGFLSVPLTLPANFPAPTPFVAQALTGMKLISAVDVWIW